MTIITKIKLILLGAVSANVFVILVRLMASS